MKQDMTTKALIVDLMSDGKWYCSEDIMRDLGITKEATNSALRCIMREGRLERRDNCAIRRRWLYRLIEVSQ